MRRRPFLAAAGVGATGLAGCMGRPGGSTEASTPPDTIYVGPDGDDAAAGRRSSPVRSIQTAIGRARPGQSVHVLAGRYFESPRTVRAGTASAPIEITGPPGAIVSGEKGDDFPDGIVIRHDHVHLTGLTFDGIQDPDRPDDPRSYILRAVMTLPSSAEYLTDLVIKPHAAGNVRGSLISLNYVEHVEVGEFTVIGPAGLRYLLTDQRGHWGGIVYVGTAPGQSLNAIEIRGELTGLDTSNDIHIHHIDNSAGHGHSELVNTKLGTHDVVVEYCTDGGGSQNRDNYPPAAVNLQSYGATVRWCDLRDGTGRGISVGSWNAAERQANAPADELAEAERRGGTDNAVYGNRIRGFPEGPFAFPNAVDGQTPAAQRHFCGNDYTAETEWDGDDPCPDAVPSGDGRGHLGGDSPWG